MSVMSLAALVEISKALAPLPQTIPVCRPARRTGACAPQMNPLPAWREANELTGRELMREGQWLIP
jgi:hypothetical protein